MTAKSTRERILAATAQILEAEGVEGLTTRAVCDATGVTAPTLYHHFGNKDGLLTKLIHQSLDEFMTQKRSVALTENVIDDLARGWETWIDFGVSRPRMFRLMIDASAANPEIMNESYAIMRRLVDRVADAGKLTIDTETAALAIWAAANGVLVLFRKGVDAEVIKITANLMFDAIRKRIT